MRPDPQYLADRNTGTDTRVIAPNESWCLPPAVLNYNENNRQSTPTITHHDTSDKRSMARSPSPNITANTPTKASDPTTPSTLRP